MRRSLHQPVVQLAIILLVALLARLAGILSRPIWYDEAFSILFAEKGVAAMLYGTLTNVGTRAAEEHPLGYYFLLSGWMRLCGESLPAVRALSVLAGMGVVFLAYLIGRELFSGTSGHLAALFVALSPFQVHYAQEMRMYALLALWLLLCTYAYLRGSRTGRTGWWALFGLSAALAQYTHSMAAVYLVPLALTPVFRGDGRTLRSVLWSGVAAMILYLPWLLHLPAQIAKVEQAYWIQRPGIEKLFTLLLVYTVNLPLPDGWLLPALFIAVAIMVLSLWQTLRMFKKRESAAAEGIWLLYLAFAPALLAVIISQWHPVFLERTFLASGAIFCAWVAWSLYYTSLPRPVSLFLTMLLAIGATVGIYQHVNYAGFPYGPYQQMGTAISQQSKGGGTIIHSNKLSILPVMYYDRDLSQEYIADPPGSSADTLAPATQQVLGVRVQPDLASAASGAERIWFIIFQTSINEYAAAGQTTHPHLAWLNEHFHLDRIEAWGDLRMYLYSR